MAPSLCASRVHRFIREIVAYHQRCSFQHTGLITLTLQMAAFALPDLTPAEVQDCILQLADKGLITILSEDPLSFTPTA